MKFSIVSLALASFASATIHTVQVAQGGLKFNPASVTAAVGDTVAFKFDSNGHTVAQGNFNKGCQPFTPSPFFSGGGSSGQTWSIIVNDTNPKAFYCSTPGHCKAGMVGVINPAGAKTLAAYQSIAKSSTSSKAPKKVQGGTFS